MRVKRGTTASNRHRKMIKQAKGMQHSRTRSFRLAKQGVIKSLQYAYRDRRNLKRDLRSVWNIRINAASRQLGVTYSQLINGMKKNNIKIDRKIMADLAVNEPKVFTKVVELAKK